MCGITAAAITRALYGSYRNRIGATVFLHVARDIGEKMDAAVTIALDRVEAASIIVVDFLEKTVDSG